MFAQRILILIPHPDDEVVGAATAIGRARARGAAVAGVFLTTGVPDTDTAWIRDPARHAARVDRRQKEAQVAASRLGLEPLIFLDHPTRSLRLHLDEAFDTVRHAIDDWAPDRLWVPAFEGGHQDHDTANALASLFAEELRIWEFAEYGKAGRQAFPCVEGNEITLPLTAAEQMEKRRLLEIYESERANLSAIGKEQENFRPLPRYDYAHPPYTGAPHYARFRWVPFRHPRVDFTDPADVTRAITSFVTARRTGT